MLNIRWSTVILVLLASVSGCGGETESDQADGLDIPIVAQLEAVANDQIGVVDVDYTSNQFAGFQTTGPSAPARPARPERPSRPNVGSPAVGGGTGGTNNGSILPLPNCLNVSFSTTSETNPVVFSNEMSIEVNQEYMVSMLGDILASELTATQSGADLQVAVAGRGSLELLGYFSGSVPDSVLIENASFPAALFFNTLLAGGNPAELLTLLAYDEAGLTTGAINENNQAVASIAAVQGSASPADADPIEPNIAPILAAEQVETPLAEVTTIEDTAVAFAQVECALDFELPDVDIPVLITEEDALIAEEVITAPNNTDPDVTAPLDGNPDSIDLAALIAAYEAGNGTLDPNSLQNFKADLPVTDSGSNSGRAGEIEDVLTALASGQYSDNIFLEADGLHLVKYGNQTAKTDNGSTSRMEISIKPEERYGPGGAAGTFVTSGSLTYDYNGKSAMILQEHQENSNISGGDAKIWAMSDGTILYEYKVGQGQNDTVELGQVNPNATNNIDFIIANNGDERTVSLSTNGSAFQSHTQDVSIHGNDARFYFKGGIYGGETDSLSNGESMSWILRDIDFSQADYRCDSRHWRFDTTGEDVD